MLCGRSKGSCFNHLCYLTTFHLIKTPLQAFHVSQCHRKCPHGPLRRTRGHGVLAEKTCPQLPLGSPWPQAWQLWKGLEQVGDGAAFRSLSEGWRRWHTTVLALASLGVFRDVPSMCCPPCAGNLGIWGLWTHKPLTIPLSHPVLVSFTDHQDGSISEEEDGKNLRPQKDPCQVSPGPLAPYSHIPRATRVSVL